MLPIPDEQEGKDHKGNDQAGCVKKGKSYILIVAMNVILPTNLTGLIGIKRSFDPIFTRAQQRFGIVVDGGYE